MNEHDNAVDIPEEVKVFISAYPSPVRNIVVRLRRLVMESAPDAVEQIDISAKMLAYSYARSYKSMICVLMPQKTWVNLGFPRGTAMSDPSGLLSGTGKKARHVKITGENETDNPAVLRLIAQAVAMAGERG